MLPPAAPDLDALARTACVVLKDEPAARVERLGSGPAAVVRKTYRNRGLRLLQTWLRRARAEREHRNLTLAASRGLPCTPPVTCSARRRFGFVLESTLVTGFVPDTTTLKQALTQGRPSVRRALAICLGELLRRTHACGLLWCTAMPRNALVQTDAAGPALVLCDLPAAIDFGRPVPVGAARIDLWDATASPSRRREWSRSERFCCLVAYCRGDRDRARALWRALAGRSPLGQRLRKNLVMALRTYILPAPRTTPTCAAR